VCASVPLCLCVPVCAVRRLLGCAAAVSTLVGHGTNSWAGGMLRDAGATMTTEAWARDGVAAVGVLCGGRSD
jgi:hypothetical protein